MRTRATAVIFLLLSTPLLGQFVSNASFEGPPQTGIPPTGWKACNDFSTPDTQPGSWEINLPPSHGNAYISLFTRGTGGYINDGYAEAIGTPLLKPLEKNVCYSFSLDLAFFPKATFVGSFGEVIIYDNPVTINIWGGNSECDKNVLLHRSAPITHQAWQTHTFSFTPEKQFTYLTLEAGYVTETKTYGSVLVDNLIIDSYSIDLGADRFVCNNASVQLSASIADSDVLWSTGSVEPVLQVTTSGIYSVEVKKGACVMKDEVSIQFLEKLTLELGNDTTICPGDTLMFDVTTPRGKYHWNTGSTLPVMKINQAGTYHVIVNNNCEQVADEITVAIDYVQCCNLSAPNVFTPNDDTLNDLFEISSPSTLQQFDLSIYNRWGGLVFRGSTLADFWDGKMQGGQQAATGIYYWIASIGCTHKDVIFHNTYRGTLTLIR